MDLVRENEIEASVCQSGTTNPYTISSLYFFFVISPLSWASQTSNRNSKQTQFCVRNSNSVSQPEASALPTRLEREQKWERAGVATLGGKARHVSGSIYLVHSKRSTFPPPCSTCHVLRVLPLAVVGSVSYVCAVIIRKRKD